MIGFHAAEARHAFLSHAGGLRKRGCLTAEKRLTGAIEPLGELFTTALDRAELAPDQPWARHGCVVVPACDGGADVPGTWCGRAVSARR